MKLKSLVLALGIIFLYSPLTYTHAGCSGPSPAGEVVPSWLNQNWQGIMFGLFILGPWQHFYNEEGSKYLRYLKRTYWDTDATKKAPDCCSCHDHP